MSTPDAEHVRVITFNTAAGNRKIKTNQADFVTLPFYREAFADARGAPLLALQEVGPAQSRALDRDAGSARVIQVRRPGLGNALVVPARYAVLSSRRRFYLGAQLLGILDALRRWARREREPNWRQFGELRMWIEARLLDRASGRRFTLINTHLSVEPALKVAQARTLASPRAGRRRTRPGDPGRRPQRPGRQHARARRRGGAAARALPRHGHERPPRRPNIDYVLAEGFEPVSSRIWSGDALQLPGSPNAEAVSDHYAEDDVLRYAGAAGAA